VNDLLPFLDFVEHHPVGSSVNGVVESYSSHGAYVAIGDVLGYVPLRLMGEPPPRSAREVMKLAEAVTLVVTSFAPARRSIDLAIPKVAPVGELVPSPVLEEIAESVAPAKPSRRRGTKKAPPQPVATAIDEAVAEAALEVLEATPVAEETSPAAPAGRPRKAPAKKAATKKAAAKKAPATKKAATTKAAAKQVAPVPVATAATPAKKAPAKKAPAKKVAPTKAAATKKTTAKKAAAPAKRTARSRAVAPLGDGA
jgi:hypothetical protein